MSGKHQGEINNFFARLATLGAELDRIKMQNQLINFTMRQHNTLERSKDKIQANIKSNDQLLKMLKQDEEKMKLEYDKNEEKINTLQAKQKKAKQAEKEGKQIKTGYQKEINKLKGEIVYGNKNEKFAINALKEGEIDLKNIEIRDLEYKMSLIEETCLILEGQIEEASIKQVDPAKLKNTYAENKKDILTIAQKIAAQKINLEKLEKKLAQLEQNLVAQESKNTELQYQASSLNEQASNLVNLNEDMKFELEKTIKDAQLQKQNLRKELSNALKIIEEEESGLKDQNKKLKQLQTKYNNTLKDFQSEWESLKPKLSKEDMSTVEKRFEKMWRAIDPTLP